MASKSLKNYIDKNIQDCNNDLEIAYTIYILLGKVLYYSPLYARYKMNSLVPDVDSISIYNPYVNCNTWSDLYNELLLEYGIDSRVMGDKHKYVEFSISDMVVRGDATIYLPDGIFDISSDLTNIKYGLNILYFRLNDNKYRDEFNKTIDTVNRRFKITRGNDSIINEDIEDMKNESIDNRIKYGINFYNMFYNLCDGEVERRQLFERYYPLLFEDIDNSVVDFYDSEIMSKHLLIFDDKYYLESKNGFTQKSYDEIMDLINSNKIHLKYDRSISKVYKKS